ncbi:N-acyl-D-amino-acid deacylase family protein [Miniphocaeibacter halophilus]
MDAKEKIVTPGFIDVHMHSDSFVFNKHYGVPQIREGVTSSLNGNCGLSIVPLPKNKKNMILNTLRPVVGRLPKDKEFESFPEYLKLLEKNKHPINFGMNIGNGTLRMAVKGFDKGKLSEEEIQRIHKLLIEAINSGAFAVSLGLEYMPENLYSTEEIIEVLMPIKNTNIPLVTHIRGEGNLLVSSIKEVIYIAKKLNVPLHISHLKCIGKKNWGHLLNEAIKLIENAQNNGMKITADVYPWTAGSTQLVKLLPPQFLEGGEEETLKRLKDPKQREICKNILSKDQEDFENILYLIGWESVMITTVDLEKNQKYVGKLVSEIAKEENKDPYDFAFDLLIEEDLKVSMVNFSLCEDDVERIIKLPFTFIISDSIFPKGGLIHPRQYGSFARFLEIYINKKKILSLEEGIYKITGFPAEVFNIRNKGKIKVGYDADLVIFDLENIKNNSDYINSMEYASGFDYVFVAGEMANKKDKYIEVNVGRILRGEHRLK